MARLGLSLPAVTHPPLDSAAVLRKQEWTRASDRELRRRNGGRCTPTQSRSPGVVILERINDLDPRAAKILVVTRRDRQVMPPSDRRDVTVFNRH
jgi:hypothetical protein